LLTTRVHTRLLSAAVLAVLVAGCGSDQSALNPRSHASRDIATLWWWMLAIAATVLGGAVFLLLLAWIRRHRPGLPILGGRDKISFWLVVFFGIVIPISVNVTVFAIANFVVAKATEPPAEASTQLTIRVVGHQWFWEVAYPGTPAVTANEFHIPVGERVTVIARTADVIHSFWVPQLNRKIDTIPGHPNRLLLRAERPGRYRGQCAEFCGVQHAHMSMYVYADPPDRFRAWLQQEAASARQPTTPQQRRGEQVFLSNACASCHTIRGTSARGIIGPDLTHLASRSTLAALTIKNTPGELDAWIRDPQHIKPGNLMPKVTLSNRERGDLVAYLESLR
jgi:cytochrome c oxidase subunit 2